MSEPAVPLPAAQSSSHAGSSVEAASPAVRASTAAVPDDPRWEPGMPILDRQPITTERPPIGDRSGSAPALHPALPPSLLAAPPRSVPETRPTPLQKHYVLLCVPGLVAGAVAITALESGTALGSPLIKVCVVMGAPLLAVANADAIVRIWRSAWAWLPVDRGRGLFRFAWSVVAVLLWGLLVLAAILVLAS